MLTVKEALDIIRAVWKYLPSVEKHNVNEHLLWDIIIPGYDDDDYIDESIWEDILSHIVWYIPEDTTK